VIRISIKNGNIDAALDKFKAAKKEQNRKFDEQVAAHFAPKGQDEPEQTPAKRAPSYQSILTRSRRIG
jgi:ribosomal protein S21